MHGIRVLALALVVLLSFTITSCQDQSSGAVQAAAELELHQRTSFIEAAVNIAGGDAWILLQDTLFPPDYESLIESGVLAIIPSNPYTGEDIAITREYSPGDIYVSFPTVDDPIYRFWRHMGEDDWQYDAELYAQGEIVALEGWGEGYTIDGRTIYLTEEMPDYMDEYLGRAYDPSEAREARDIPGDDDARTRMYIVAYAMNRLAQNIGRLDEPPESLDEYISLLGRRNPVAWINPYTGEPMQEVGWVRVPFYDVHDNVPDASPSPQEWIDKEALAGNYSVAVGHHPYYPTSQLPPAACIQFYFYLPDGSIAAYLVIATST